MRDFIRQILYEETKWTFDILKDIASKFNTRSEFRVGNPNAYNSALRQKFMNDITIHMGEPKAQKKDNQKFIEKSKSLYGDKFTYEKVNYINTNTPVIINCNNHGDFIVTPKEHYTKKNGGCQKCNNRYRRNVEDFIKEANLIHNNKYNYDKVNFDKISDKITITCPIHKDFTQQARAHLRGNGCIQCAGLKRVTTNEFIQKAHEVHNNKYEYSKVIYKNNRTPVLITCKKHGDFPQAPSNHLLGHGCPKCIESLGEKTIQLILDKNNIVYIKQKKFKDCLGIGKKFCRQLPFDFYLPSFNTCIEYDGRQHTQPAYGEEQLEIQKKIDKIKDDYCLKNNINLVRVPFTLKKDNVEIFLKKELGIQ